MVRGDVLNIHGVVVAGEGVGALAADGGHAFIVLVGNGDGRCNVADGVNLVVDFGTFFVVFCLAIDFVQGFDFVQFHFLAFPVGGAKFLATFEHHVLQVVGQAGGFFRVIFRTCTYGNVGLDAWCILVDAHEHLEAVFQRVLAYTEGVVGVGLVLILLCAHAARQHDGYEAQHHRDFFHSINCL